MKDMQPKGNAMLSEYEAKRIQEAIQRDLAAPCAAATLVVVLAIGVGLGWLVAMHWEAFSATPQAAPQAQRLAAAC